MGTRSDIIVQRADGKFARVYCHWDGYLSHNGVMLATHYNSQELAEALVSLGDISTLGEVIGEKHDFDFRMKAIGREGYESDPEYIRLKAMCLYYGRDRGEEGTEALIFNTLAEAVTDLNEYTYIWSRTKPSGWFLLGGGGKMIPLVKAIKADAAENAA
jgi:hypothetical protein